MIIIYLYIILFTLMDPTTPTKDQKVTIVLFNKGTNRIIPRSIDSKTPVTSKLLFRETKKSPKSDSKVITHKIPRK